VLTIAYVAVPGRVRSLCAGGLEIADAPVQVSATDLTHEADGIVGLDLFQDFLIRLDAPARSLELDPLPSVPWFSPLITAAAG